MIAEALNYAASLFVTPAAFRPALSSAVRLWSRAGRCRRQWRAHEERCKDFIRDRLSALSQRRTCVVLGSGLLRDVPVSDLSEAFDRVLLVDLAHLAPVRFSQLLAGRRNLRFVHRDLSGLDDMKAGLPPAPLAFLKEIDGLDLVISANLLSQIGIGIERRLAREGDQGLPQDAVGTLLNAHLDGLKSAGAPAILLTDTDFTIQDLSGRVEERKDLMHSAHLPEALASWDWPVVPPGEMTRNFQAIHRVIAACYTVTSPDKEQQP
nr:hypothetical protein [uncultured Gellertiella sp.]